MVKDKSGVIVSGGKEPRTIVRRGQLRRLTGYSIGHIYALIQQGKFPPPVKLGPRASGWFGDEIASWQAERAAERDGEAA
jgi:prophage regulatory protein